MGLDELLHAAFDTDDDIFVCVNTLPPLTYEYQSVMSILGNTKHVSVDLDLGGRREEKHVERGKIL